MPNRRLPGDRSIINPRRPRRIAAPDGDAARLNGDDASSTSSRPGCVCLDDDTIDRLARAIVGLQQQAPRGSVVRGPSSCVQPASGADFDDSLVGSTTLPANTVGESVVLLEARAAQNEVIVVKGIGVAIVQSSSTSTLDPWSFFEVVLTVNNQPVDPYLGLRFSPGFGLQALRSVTVQAKRGQLVRMILRRHATGGAGFVINATWKGWRYVPTTESDSAIIDSNAY